MLTLLRHVFRAFGPYTDEFCSICAKSVVDAALADTPHNRKFLAWFAKLCRVRADQVKGRDRAILMHAAQYSDYINATRALQSAAEALRRKGVAVHVATRV